MEVPDLGPYKDKDWTVQQKGHGAMIDRMDRDIGRIMARLAELSIDRNTLVFFTSDNGPHKEGGYRPEFFKCSGPLRGLKRDLYEGGIRVPTVARWPEHILAGTTSREPLAFWDVLPTLAQIANAKPPGNLDGISFLPTLLGKQQKSHDYLYWEFHEKGYKQAVRQGNYKAVLNNFGKLELYDLEADLGEHNDIAGRHANIVARMETIMKSARTDSKEWPIKHGARTRPKP
jgi:arylsulfatase A-like enzyme